MSKDPWLTTLNKDALLLSNSTKRDANAKYVILNHARPLVVIHISGTLTAANARVCLNNALQINHGTLTPVLASEFVTASFAI